MGYVFYNPNPIQNRVEDCAVRSICAAENEEWDKVYMGLSVEGFFLKDMPDSKDVWWSYLRRLGYNRSALPNTCPDCYTVSDFAQDYPEGTYILATTDHVVCVKNGDILDTWDSSDKTPLYYWTKDGK